MRCAVSDLTPAAIEQKLRQCVNDLAKGQTALQAARDLEVGRKHEYEAARRRAILSAECPKVRRDGVTALDRDAWVEEQAASEQRAYEIAEAWRKASEDHLRTTRDQSMICMALSRSVQTAYQLAGVSS